MTVPADQDADEAPPPLSPEALEAVADRDASNSEQKDRVAQAALAFLPPTGGSVILDAGTTTARLAPLLPHEPAFTVGGDVLYYAVDHSPSYLWNSATWENSEALLPFLRTVLGGGDAWDADPTIRRAIEIRDGVIQNPAILSFQGRTAKHPHTPLAT